MLRRVCALLALFLICAAYTSADEKPELPLEGHTETLSFTTDAGSWLSLDVTPDGRFIVFDLLGDLYRLPVEGGNAERLTSGLGFDSQPVVSPDGEWLAFISDRDGSDNLWVSRSDGSDARKVSDESQHGLISPAWMPDGRYLVVTRTADNTELVMYHVDGGTGVTLTGPDDATKFWGVGAAPAADGRSLYLAAEAESNGPVEDFPAAQIVQYDLTSGHADPVTRGEGGGFRPALSPDGRWLVYGTRDDGRTGLRIRDLESGSDRWLVYPVQRDAQENFRPPSRDLLPRHAFVPDGSEVIYNADGGFHAVDLQSGQVRSIPFRADVALDVGPDLSAPYRVPQGPLTATLIHDPAPSPDGGRVVASVLARLYVADTAGGDPAPLTDPEQWAFKPAWSPDGRWIAYVTWSMDEGGHIWRLRASGRGEPQQLTQFPAFYTDIAYTPDGDHIVALRGNAWMRHQTFSEFTGLGIPLDLVRLPADGGEQTLIRPAREARHPHFGPDPERVYLYGEKGLFSVTLDGGDERTELVVTGPKGNRRSEEPPPAGQVWVSPNGGHALALINEQVWVLPFSTTGGKPTTIAVRKPAFPAARITDIGADFIGWSADGETVHWAIGNAWYSRPLSSIEFRSEDEPDADNESEDAPDEPFVPRDEHDSVSVRSIEVTQPRPTPGAAILLSGGNVIPMAGGSAEELERVLRNHDVLIVDNRIDAVGPSGTLDVPVAAETVDVSGRYLLPGFIDTHAHWEFRTGDVLEPHNWSLAVNLAYGVTAGLDVQTAYKDYFAYRDFQALGRSIGQRAFMVGRGVFGNTDFESFGQAKSYLRRYAEHYHTPNIKAYLSGNRKQRQWIVLAARELGLMPTTEGGADQKLDLTHAIDGMHGNEHNLPDLPIFDDVVRLYAETRTAYTPTLIVQYNAERMREYFFTRENPHDDPKLRRFYPANRLDELTERRPGWQLDSEFAFRAGAEVAAQIQRAGGLVGVGGHAELQGLGYHWEMWAYAMGGMRPVEVLKAATIDGARIIGIDQDLGSLEAGKLADIVVLDANPLDDIRNSSALRYVMQDGRLFDGESLDELWPEQRSLPPFWWWEDDSAP